MKKVLLISFNDLRNILREPMLIIILIGPLLLTVFLRFFIPWIERASLINFDLGLYYPLISGYQLIFVPFLMGMVTGFLLLDERDEGVYMSLIVTPLSMKGYILYRILIPTIVTFIYGLMVFPILGLIKISSVRIISLALITSLEAPLIAMGLGVLAHNKVEGLVLSKGLGLLLLAPLIGYYIKSNWSLLAGIVPIYWPMMAIVHQNMFWIYIILGLIVHLIYLYITVDTYKNKIF